MAQDILTMASAPFVRLSGNVSQQVVSGGFTDNSLVEVSYATATAVWELDDYPGAALDTSSATDLEIVFLVRFDSDVTNFYIDFHPSGWSTWFGFDIRAGDVRMFLDSSGTSEVLVDTSVNISDFAGQGWFFLRMRKVGDLAAFQFWPYGQDEPSSDFLSTTFSGTLNSLVEAYITASAPTSSGASMDFDHIAFGTEGDPAPRPLSGYNGLRGRDDGVWKEFTPYGRDGGVWKPLIEVYGRDDGVWKELYS